MPSIHGSRDARPESPQETACGDIERLRIENTSLTARLRETESRFTLFMDSSPDACLLLDRDLRYVYFNKMAEWLTGEDLATATGKPIPIALPGGDPGGRLRLYLEVLRSGEPLTVDDVAPGGVLGARRFRVRAFKAGEGLGLIWTDITEYKRAEERLTAAQAELRALAVHLIDVREDERKSFARELHDELGQILTAIDMELRWMYRMHEAMDQGVKERIEGQIDRVAQAIRFVQRVSAELRPGVLDHLGLPAAIEWLAREFSKSGDRAVSTDIDILEDDLDEKATTALFRITQEALTNAARHSRASAVEISLKAKENGLELSITDDGIGIAWAQTEAPESFGIQGIRERARALGGNLSILGEEGKGTRLLVSIPFRSEDL
jgi:PAS domain S-box-containing protein